MDAKASAPEMTSSNSTYPGSYSSSISKSLYGDFVEKDRDFNSESIENGGVSNSSNSGNNDTGFVSGEEKFEMAPEKPSVVEPVAEAPGKGVMRDNSDSFAEGLSEPSMPKNVLPTESALVNVDGGDDIVGDAKIRVLKEEEAAGEVTERIKGIEGEGFVEKLENGGGGSGEWKSWAEIVSKGKSNSREIEHGKVEEAETEVKDVEGVEKSKNEIIEEKSPIALVENEEKSALTSDSPLPGGAEAEEGPASRGQDDDEKSVEGQAVKFASGGDSIVDSVDVNVSPAEPGVAIVGNVEEIENKGSKERNPIALVEDEEKSVEISDGPMPGGGAEQEGEPASHGQGGDENSVEEEFVKFTGGGDSIVDSVHVNVSPAEPGVAIVGDVEETETKGTEVLVDESVSLRYEIDKTSRDVMDPDDLTAAYDGNTELVANNIVEAREVEPHEKNSDFVVENGDFDGDKVASDSLAKAEHRSGQDKEEAEAPADELLNLGMGDEEKRPVEELQKQPKAESVEEVILSGNKIDEESENADHFEDAVSESAQGTATQKKAFQNEEQEDVASIEPHLLAEEEVTAVSERGFNIEGEDVEKNKTAEGEIEGSGTDGESEEMIFGSSEAAKQFLEELEKAAGVGSHSGPARSNDQSERIDGQIITDSDEEVDTDDEGEGKELFDSAALAALLKAASGSSSDAGNITITSQDGSRLFSVERPAGLGSSLRSVKPAPRANRSNLFTHLNPPAGGEIETDLSEEEKKKLEKLQQLRVKFLRLVHRLGHSAEDSIAAQVLYRLSLLAGRQTGQVFSLESAKTLASKLEEEAKDDFDFSLTILVLGKAGVGKSATINSIFGDQKAQIDAFQPATTLLREITGLVDGVKIRVIDTPGLKSSGMEQSANRKLLSSIKKMTKKCPPDIVLYVDRLDTQTRDLNDLPLLRTITSVLGSAIWRNAIVTLTHAASAPPDGPSGSPLSYEVFVAQRSHVVQQSIGQAVGDLRLMSPSLMNPVSLVENHSSCRKNRDGQKVLPNGQTWRPQLLLLCYSMKILAEASAMSKPQDPFDHKKLFGFRVRSPPLPYLLSWLLQSRTHPKLPADQGGDSVDSDIDLDDLSDSDREDEEDEYDQLPPFKPLRRAQLAKLSREQKKAYFDEYDYRVKLLQKKQWREELKRMRDMKKKGKVTEDEFGYGGEEDPENGAPAAVPVPLPDMALPPSFDGDNPAYRYRFLEPTSQLLTRPVLDTHGWDHDCGYDGVNIEHSLALVNRFPAAVMVQLTKDKKEFNIHMDSSIATKHGENSSSMAGFDIQNVGKQLAYVVRGETKFKALKKSKAALGASVTFLGENVATGVKLEDQISLGKRLVLIGSTGTVRSQGDSAYGANLEVRLREADFPIGQDQSSLSLSLVKWRGDLALGANVQSQISVGRGSKIAVRAGLNNKLSGQITVRTSSSDQLQIALAAVLPVAVAIYKSIRPGSSESYSMY